MTTYGLRCDAMDRRAERQRLAAVNRAKVAAQVVAFGIVLAIAALGMGAAVVIGEAGW